jgi:hypothetical protein
VLHSPHFDFHDGNLVVGAAYWAALTEMLLAPGGAPEAGASERRAGASTTPA